jgi:hypothetical protein
MPTLHIQLLGGFGLVYGDEPVIGVNMYCSMTSKPLLFGHIATPAIRESGKVVAM